MSRDHPVRSRQFMVMLYVTIVVIVVNGDGWLGSDEVIYFVVAVQSRQWLWECIHSGCTLQILILTIYDQNN